MLPASTQSRHPVPPVRYPADHYLSAHHALGTVKHLLVALSRCPAPDPSPCDPLLPKYSKLRWLPELGPCFPV
eukprot:2565106-Karenia_brevis.AAC.1